MNIELDDNITRPMIMALLGIGPACRSCGADLTPASANSFHQGKRVKCACGWYGNWRDNTIMAGARINNSQFLTLFFKYIIPDDLPALANKLNLTTDTIKAWKERIQGAA